MIKEELLKIKKLQDILHTKEKELIEKEEEIFNLFFPEEDPAGIDIDLESEWVLSEIRNQQGVGKVKISIKDDFVGILFTQYATGGYSIDHLLIRSYEKGKKKKK